MSQKISISKFTKSHLFIKEMIAFKKFFKNISRINNQNNKMP